MALTADSASAEADQGSSSSPLVTVAFQKNEQRKFKFLEGEPKALGITQLCLAVFHSTCVGSLYAVGLIQTGVEIPSFVGCLFVFIAGSFAIAARRLHPPMVKACLGMETFAAIASFLNLIFTFVKMFQMDMYCYSDDKHKVPCDWMQRGHVHFFAELVVVHVALFAISVTVLVYAAKVVDCCAPAPKVPVIMIQTSAPPQ